MSAIKNNSLFAQIQDDIYNRLAAMSTAAAFEPRSEGPVVRPKTPAMSNPQYQGISFPGKHTELEAEYVKLHEQLSAKFEEARCLKYDLSMEVNRRKSLEERLVVSENKKAESEVLISDQTQKIEQLLKQYDEALPRLKGYNNECVALTNDINFLKNGHAKEIADLEAFASEQQQKLCKQTAETQAAQERAVALEKSQAREVRGLNKAISNLKQCAESLELTHEKEMKMLRHSYRDKRKKEVAVLNAAHMKETAALEAHNKGLEARITQLQEDSKLQHATLSSMSDRHSLAKEAFSSEPQDVDKYRQEPDNFRLNQCKKQEVDADLVGKSELESCIEQRTAAEAAIEAEEVLKKTIENYDKDLSVERKKAADTEATTKDKLEWYSGLTNRLYEHRNDLLSENTRLRYELSDLNRQSSGLATDNKLLTEELSATKTRCLTQAEESRVLHAKLTEDLLKERQDRNAEKERSDHDLSTMKGRAAGLLETLKECRALLAKNMDDALKQREMRDADNKLAEVEATKMRTRLKQQVEQETGLKQLLYNLQEELEVQWRRNFGVKALDDEELEAELEPERWSEVAESGVEDWELEIQSEPEHSCAVTFSSVEDEELNAESLSESGTDVAVDSLQDDREGECGPTGSGWEGEDEDSEFDGY